MQRIRAVPFWALVPAQIGPRAEYPLLLLLLMQNKEYAASDYY
jgi:hypothetical protein